MSNRIYEGGRSTEGWERGRKATTLAGLKVGDVLIEICHQFKAENLIVITAVNLNFRRCIEWRYACNVTLRNIAPDSGAISERELSEGNHYLAIDKRPTGWLSDVQADKPMVDWLAVA